MCRKETVNSNYSINLTNELALSLSRPEVVKLTSPPFAFGEKTITDVEKKKEAPKMQL